ncbi:hypothetical protein FACS1894219_12330 [Clostridia bacterium]|nr:hypothetical protein FACS1894219_12330 [Clostridia bacterium]
MKKRSFIAFTIMCLLIVSFYSCADKNIGTDKNETQPVNSSLDNSLPNTTATEYNYPEFDGENSDFRFLNATTTWFFYTAIEQEEMTADVLDDAIYTRNRFVENKFNVTIKETTKDIGAVNNYLRQVILSGEDSFDAAYCSVDWGANIGSLITMDYLVNLNNIETLNLDQNYWNQKVLKEAAIGKGEKIFYAINDVNIMDLQCMSAVYFNQDMITDLGLDLPYKMVKDGKWTFDALQTYMKAGANLNGAADYKWEQNSSTTYGLTSYEGSGVALLEGAREKFITTDTEGIPHLAVESERFENVIYKIADMLQTQGNYLYANDKASGFHCEDIFMGNRALMMIGELKAADLFRNMESTFGILPIPKFDETQDGYYTNLTFFTPVMVIPITNSRLDFTGAVLDAMAYVSNFDVTPVFFNVSVSQKQLRNDESVEMLELIRNSNSFDIGSAYGWTSDIYKEIRDALGQGKEFNLTSQIEKNKGIINAAIDKTMKYFDD